MQSMSYVLFKRKGVTVHKIMEYVYFLNVYSGLGSWSTLLWYKGSPTNNFIKGTMVMNGDIMVYFLLMKCIRRDHDNQDVWESALTTRSKSRKYTFFFNIDYFCSIYSDIFLTLLKRYYGPECYAQFYCLTIMPRVLCTLLVSNNRQQYIFCFVIVSSIKTLLDFAFLYSFFH